MIEYLTKVNKNKFKTYQKSNTKNLLDGNQK